MSADDDEEREVVDSEPMETEAVSPREEHTDNRSSEARRKLRDQMQADIESFLRAGGRIEKLEPSASAHGVSVTAGVNDLSQ